MQLPRLPLLSISSRNTEIYDQAALCLSPVLSPFPRLPRRVLPSAVAASDSQSPKTTRLRKLIATHMQKRVRHVRVARRAENPLLKGRRWGIVSPDTVAIYTAEIKTSSSRNRLRRGKSGEPRTERLGRIPMLDEFEACNSLTERAPHPPIRKYRSGGKTVGLKRSWEAGRAELRRRSGRPGCGYRRRVRPAW